MAPYRKPSVGLARSFDDLRSVLRAISKDLAAEVLEEGVRAACQPILVAAKRYAKRSEATGALRDSLTIKTVAYEGSGKAVGLVGPDRAYRVKGRKVGKLGALFGALRGDIRRPANYAHLVEYGHAIAKGGSLRPKYNTTLVGIGQFSSKGKELKRWKRTGISAPAKGTVGGHVPAKPFLRPAVVTTRSQQHAAFEGAVGKGLDRLLAKHSRRSAA